MLADPRPQGWQATHAHNVQHWEACPSRHLKQPPNALALAINLQPLAFKDAAQWLETATQEDIDSHKGMRSTFVIVDMLFPGFTYISTGEGSSNSDGGAKGDFASSSKGGGRQKSSSYSQAKGDPLGVFDDEHPKTVILYTYKGEQNKKLGYLKTKHFDECAALSPGWSPRVLGASLFGMTAPPPFDVL